MLPGILVTIILFATIFFAVFWGYNQENFLLIFLLPIALLLLTPMSVKNTRGYDHHQRLRALGEGAISESYITGYILYVIFFSVLYGLGYIFS